MPPTEPCDGWGLHPYDCGALDQPPEEEGGPHRGTGPDPGLYEVSAPEGDIRGFVVHRPPVEIDPPESSKR